LSFQLSTLVSLSLETVASQITSIQIKVSKVRRTCSSLLVSHRLLETIMQSQVCTPIGWLRPNQCMGGKEEGKDLVLYQKQESLAIPS
jgi:hypothetical protein